MTQITSNLEIESPKLSPCTFLDFPLATDLDNFQADIAILGVPFGMWACKTVVARFSTDLYRMPFYFEYSSIVIAIALTLVFVTIANLAVRRRLRTLDLVEVLKARE